ncbi:uncharacterized protein LOC115455880 [Manduca sexta]|uniref:uncharacterized protein LOC115455880 n=1 Tax=Manduca sexta TaxID=7130 RepID=UPI00188E5AA3|nr:uncharacterized protein LOC115455880 [Manduca sexta]
MIKDIRLSHCFDFQQNEKYKQWRIVLFGQRASLVVCGFNMNFAICITFATWIRYTTCRDEDKIMKACFWPNEVYEPCFGGCAEVSCDNPRNHLRPCYPYCEPGCVCEEPYVRDDRTHQCVLPQDCSPTQMGIPVPTKRVDRTPAPKYSSRTRGHGKRDDIPAEYSENDHTASQQ